MDVLESESVFSFIYRCSYSLSVCCCCCCLVRSWRLWFIQLLSMDRCKVNFSFSFCLFVFSVIYFLIYSWIHLSGNLFLSVGERHNVSCFFFHSFLNLNYYFFTARYADPYGWRQHAGPIHNQTRLVLLLHCRYSDHLFLLPENRRNE